MNENYEQKKFGADKLAFLGLFLVSLLIARLIVYVNSGLSFSDPIELAHTGLSISIPNGKGWQSTNKWQYEDDAYVLISSFLPQRGYPEAAVKCQYFTNSQNISPEAWLKQYTDEPNSLIIKTDRILNGNMILSWAGIDKPFIAFSGIVELPGNRMLSIEVIQTTLEIDMAERVFKKIINSLDFKEENSIKAGMEIVTELKSRGIDSLINSSNREISFLIRDSENNNIGFTVDLLDNSDTDASVEKGRVHGASRLFLTGRNRQEQTSFFESDNNFNSYTWQSQSLSRTGTTETKIVLEETGTINVSASVNNESRQKQYRDNSYVVPTMLLELVIEQVVRRNVKELVFDTIDSGGNIDPALITFEPPDSNDADYTGVIRLEFLDGRGYSQLLYLDDNNRISKEVIQQDIVYILERTTLESIKKEFPSQAEKILQQNQPLDNNI